MLLLKSFIIEGINVILLVHLMVKINLGFEHDKRLKETFFLDTRGVVNKIFLEKSLHY